ncbi:MAG: EAL domain-containing protein [Granulosicoccaceae bacterium]
MPSLWSQHQTDGAALQRVQKSQLQAAVRNIDTQNLASAKELLGNDLTGLTLTDAQGKILVSAGEVPEMVELYPQGGAEVKSNKSGTIDTVWRLDGAESTLWALVRLDNSSVYTRTVDRALSYLLVAVLISLAGAIVALFTAARFYINPLNNLVKALRESREASEGNIPDPISYSESEDIDPLADEFNSLIEAQKKAARQVKVKQQYLEFAAHHDPLTHLPNRLMFEDALKGTIAEAMTGELNFAVFLVDLDNFKFFNDQYGHLVGDKMVAEVGNRLRAMMRDQDLVARLDGDEFAVIQKDVGNRAAAKEIAQRLMNVATQPYEYRGFTLKASVSVGISCYPQDVNSFEDADALGEEIVNNATVALQESKNNGKNQYQLFNESMRSRLTARIRLEQDLKLALQEGQFEVYFQPKININTRAITGSEALVRWKHPANGYISPEIFVPVAEEAGMIIELGEWILRTACKATYELQQSGYAGLNIAVNISAVQFTDGNLLPLVNKALKDSKLNPEYLELEITESAVMHDPEEVINSLHQLSEFGMSLAIDDFGTGYSSLAYLKRFPVNTLKIDRAFITDISSDNDDVAIVEAVLGLGKHFNMKVVAEGVEDEEQLQFLKVQGCDIAQGFYISKPMNIVDYREWLERWPYGVEGTTRLEDLPNNLPRASGSDIV